MKIPATWNEAEVITSSSLKPSSSAPLTSSSSHSSFSSKTSNTTKPQQCLRFAPTITVVEIPNRDDYTREELCATWFQALDYEDFREHSYMTMGLYRAGLLGKSHATNHHATNHTMRGLEGRLAEVAREREWTRYHATAAVLNEQYQQYRLGYSNPQAIADRYHAVSWKSQYNAYTQAMLDEQEQMTMTTLTLSTKVPPGFEKQMSSTTRRSDTKNLLRRVIDIERTCADTTIVMMDAPSCSLTATTANAADFDINSFFQEMTVSAQ